MAINPYRMKLKKVSRARIRLLDALYSYLPASGLRDKFLAGLKDSVERLVGEGFTLMMETVDQEDYSSYLSRLPQHPLVAVIGLAPHGAKLLCEIDSTLAMMAVERMLGGHVETMPEPRPLSDTEQGILQYLILKLLIQTHRACGMDARVHFRFDKFAFSQGELERLAPQEAGVAIVAYRATLGRHAGFIRLAFTEPFVEEAILEVKSPGETRPLELSHAMHSIGRFDYVRVPMWVEAGRTVVNAADINQLEEGDVVLLEQGDTRLSEGVEGSGVLRVGKGAHGGMDVSLTLDPKHARCRVKSIHKGV
jgi:flagellar motor switch protein FliM